MIAEFDREHFPMDINLADFVLERLKDTTVKVKFISIDETGEVLKHIEKTPR